MRILFLTNQLESIDKWNGWSRYSVDLIREVQEQGNEVLCITNKKSLREQEFDEICILKNPLDYLANPANSFFASRQVAKIIKDFSPEVIHFLVEPYATILPFLNGKAKAFITLHGTYSYSPILLENHLKKKIARYLTDKMYKKISGIIAVSNYTKNHLLNYLPELAPKIKVVSNGIDLKKIKVFDINRAPNIVKKILFVGAVKHRKGILESLKALEYYKNNFSPEFFYDIAGHYEKDDPYYGEILRVIRNYKLTEAVSLRGRVTEEELENLYRQADLFLMLSKNNGKAFEGFGLVYLEANARGVSCLGAKGSGVEEAIVDGKTGYVVDGNDYREVASKLDLILNKNVIKRDDCIRWARENSIEKKAEEIIKIYISQH